MIKQTYSNYIFSVKTTEVAKANRLNLFTIINTKNVIVWAEPEEMLACKIKPQK